ncbi:hypothetical protein [Ferruginibacter sp.]|uniref:hypothetical protein n=1 Tax=Ferruginibacter sp. TaxID=1940288 RepID=UPI0019C95574|nr:hypothetical protein [Ferruginibacter sp.]MBC7628551.1 hypothetical protein [Ferruginibacter sp.]
MNNDLKDILSNSNKDIDNQQLMDYLSHHISQADMHELEKSMAEDDFINDAVEGLQEIKPTKNLQIYVEQLNKDLQKQVIKNKSRRLKRRIKDQPYTYFAIILILLLVIIGYIVLKRNNRPLPAINKITAIQKTTAQIISKTWLN